MRSILRFKKYLKQNNQLAITQYKKIIIFFQDQAFQVLWNAEQLNLFLHFVPSSEISTKLLELRKAERWIYFTIGFTFL